MKITKKEAKAANDKFYRTGIKCINGHYAKRYTANGSCVTCCSLDRLNNPEKHRLAVKKSIAKNPEKHKKMLKRYREKYYEKYQEYQRAYYQRNKKHLLQYSKEYIEKRKRTNNEKN